MISLDAALAQLGYATTIDAVASALRDGLDPEALPLRTVGTMRSGQMLLMTAELGDLAGIKVATVAPGNPARALPRIQGTYLLFDGDTLSPLAMLDAEELTGIRTASVSAAVADVVAAPDATVLHVFGAGVQALTHIRALAAVRPVRSIRISARRASSVERLIEQLGPVGAEIRRAESEDAAEADLIVCATTSPTPVIPEDVALRAGSLTMAIGSHEPHVREVGTATIAGANVIVDAISTASHENGNVVIPLRTGELDPATLLTMAGVVRGESVILDDRPTVFASSGMPWQDLAVVSAAYRHASTSA